MKRKEYLAKRELLMNEAKQLLNEGKLEEVKAMKQEIENLDETFEKAAKEEANLNALEGRVKTIDPKNQSVTAHGTVVASTTIGTTEKQMDDSEEYERVFAKIALKRELNDSEIELYNKYNPENVYTHTTENTEVVIPKSVTKQIISVMKELHPILEDVTPTHIKGVVRYPIHKSVKAGDAKYYVENAETEEEENEFGELVLSGKELSKDIEVSWKLQAMAIDEFIPYLKTELGERMAAAKAKAFLNGTGNTTEPKGVITAIKAEASTPQKVEYKSTGLTYKDVTTARGKLKSMYSSGAKIYANNATIWGELANVTDGQGRPLFVPDPTGDGVGRVLGLVVKEEDALKDGEILIGNMGRGYKENIQEDMKLITDQNAKKRTTSFVGYEVHDGGPIDTGAFVYIVKGV